MISTSDIEDCNSDMSIACCRCLFDFDARDANPDKCRYVTTFLWRQRYVFSGCKYCWLFYFSYVSQIVPIFVEYYNKSISGSIYLILCIFLFSFRNSHTGSILLSTRRSTRNGAIDSVFNGNCHCKYQVVVQFSLFISLCQADSGADCCDWFGWQSMRWWYNHQYTTNSTWRFWQE